MEGERFPIRWLSRVGELVHFMFKRIMCVGEDLMLRDMSAGRATAKF